MQTKAHIKLLYINKIFETNLTNWNDYHVNITFAPSKVHKVEYGSVHNANQDRMRLFYKEEKLLKALLTLSKLIFGSLNKLRNHKLYMLDMNITTKG